MFDKVNTPFGPIYLESEKTGTTGLALSGGVESTLLLYMLCARGQPPDRLFHVSVKTGLQPLRAASIVSWINERFSLNLQLESLGRFGSTHYLGPDMKGLAELVDTLYCARNAQPPLTSDYAGPRMAAKPNVKLNSRPKNKSKIAQPFLAYDKRMPLVMFKHYDIMDLYALTWSCDENDVPEHCRVCYSCSDRFWAESKVFNE